MHHGKRRVLTAAGQWRTPILLGFLDDHSRLGCHFQWYLAETAEVFVHGLCQAFMKRGLPRALMTDNGAAMTAGEVEEGLHRLGIFHAKTMAYNPYQNGKCEVWWNAVERLGLRHDVGLVASRLLPVRMGIRRQLDRGQLFSELTATLPYERSGDRTPLTSMTFGGLPLNLTIFHPVQVSSSKFTLVE